MDAYKRHGYKDRDHYLNSLAEEYGVDEYIVRSAADVLGPNEDFDGLVAILEDM